MRIFYVPIEPYNRRYTADWIKQFEDEFISNNVTYTTVLGDSCSDKIETGDVLDAYNTNLYKLSQLQKLLLMIKDKQIADNDIIFFADGWFPGVETLAYIRNMTKIKFKLACVLHAGTWDTNDFTCRNGMREWGKHFENAFLEFYDCIFVATNYHKQLIIDRQHIIGDNIYVTGIPFYANKLRQKYLSDDAKKENIVIFPHRNNIEKHPELFDALSKKYPNWQFIKSLEICDDRDSYFNLLAKSKIMVSFADQETFGYAAVEAMALNNFVVVPNKLSYKETVPEKYRYDCSNDLVCTELDIKSVCEKIDSFIKFGDDFDYDIINKYEKAIPNMINILRRLYGV